MLYFFFFTIIFISISGGNIEFINNCYIHTFISNDTLNIPNDITIKIEYLIVGGGGGGAGISGCTGGGGAGGLIHSNGIFKGKIPIIIGQGGLGGN